MNGFDLSTIKGLYVGSTEYSAIYKGSAKIWEATSTDYSLEYFTIESLEDNNEFKLIIYSIYGTSFTYSERIIYYSKDKQNWIQITATTQNSSEATTIETLNKGEKLYLKSTNNGLGMNNSGRYGGTNIYLSKTFNVYGNIMSLLYGDDFVGKTTLNNNYNLGGQYNFYALLANSKVVNASNLILPATSIAYYCYHSMFTACHNLTAAPELPARSLQGYCYYGMFQNCSSLTAAPELSATTLADSCYRYMFYGCTNIITAPQLPATTLTDSCYRNMFQNCVSITAAPELPATTLATNCYYSMFQGCYNITSVPQKLPATKLFSNCYYSMFYGCTSITTAPELPATTLADNCYYSMFLRCLKLTTAPELPATTLAANCYSSMFQNCVALTTAPELPATTLQTRCYMSMFRDCTSLTTAPELPATSLVTNCYTQMFYSCKLLNYVKALFTTDISSVFTYTNNWLYNVASTGTFVKNQAAAWSRTDASGIPSGWTVTTI